MTSDNALSRPQVFGFLLGIDLKGMGAPGNENDEDQTRDMPPSSSAGGAQSDSKQAEQEEEEVNICSAAFSIDLPTVCLNCRVLELFRLQADVENSTGVLCAALSRPTPSTYLFQPPS